MYTLSSSNKADIELKNIAKFGVVIYIFYICWFMPSFGDRIIVLYGTAFLSCFCMILDIIINRKSINDMIPYGVLNNMIMCAYSILTGVYLARNTSILLGQVKTYFAFSLMGIVCCYISFEEKGIDWIAKTFVAVATICCISVLTRGYYREGYGYVLSGNNNPNSLGLILNMGIISLAYLWKKAIWKTLISMFLTSLFVYCIIGCGSRKCLIGAAIICILWIIPIIGEILKERSIIKGIFMVIILAVVILFLAFLFKDHYFKSQIYIRMQRLGGDEGSSSLRKEYYRIAKELFFSHPLFGIGFYQFIYYNSHNSYSHSTYAEALACWGGIGSIVYFFPILLTIIRSFKLIMMNGSYRSYIVTALIILELFLGVGTIFFYSADHLLAWTMIYLYIQYEYKKTDFIIMRSKYFKA